MDIKFYLRVEITMPFEAAGTIEELQSSFHPSLSLAYLLILTGSYYVRIHRSSREGRDQNARLMEEEAKTFCDNNKLLHLN